MVLDGKWYCFIKVDFVAITRVVEGSDQDRLP
jgi:hypothetical protein